MPSLSSDPGLKRFYNWANCRWFGGELPDVAIYWDVVAAGEAEILRLGDGEFVIKVNPALRGWTERTKLAILHELCHVKCLPNLNHGRKFQAEMQRLAAQGCFARLW